MFVTHDKGHFPAVALVLRATRDPRLNLAHSRVLSFVARMPLEWVSLPEIERRNDAAPVHVPAKLVAPFLVDLVALDYLLVEDRDGVPHYALFVPVEVRQ
jgi:hypothetical protein